MILKQRVRSADAFESVIDYVEDKEGATRIGGNMSAQTKAGLALEFQACADRNSRCESPCLHFSLSVPQGEGLNDADWKQIVDDYLEKIGYVDNQFIVYRHADTEHDHVHVVLNLVGMEQGLVADRSFDYFRGQIACRELEDEYNLTRVNSSWEKDWRNAPDGERRRFEREQDAYEQGKRDEPPEPIKLESLQAAIDEVIHESDPAELTVPVFVEKLAERGIKAQITHYYGEYGIRYGTTDGFWAAGVQLGSGYTFNGIQEKGVVYEPSQRDEIEIMRAGQITEQTRTRYESDPQRLAKDARKVLREAIKVASQGNPEMPEFIERLVEQNIYPTLAYKSTGEVKGIKYAVGPALNQLEFSGSDLGQDYTWNGVQKIGVRYERSHDDTIKRLTSRQSLAEDAKETLRNAIKAISQDQPEMPEFLERLKMRDIYPVVSYNSTGDVQDIRYAFGPPANGLIFSADDLGNDYTWQGIQAGGVRYERRHDKAIKELAVPVPSDRPGLETNLLQQWINQNEKDPDVEAILKQMTVSGDDEKALKQWIKETIKTAIADQPALSDFMQRLKQQGIDVKVSFRKEEPYGITYSYAGQKFTGSQLTESGTSYALAHLRAKGVQYDPSQDDEIRQITEQLPATIAEQLELLYQQKTEGLREPERIQPGISPSSPQSDPEILAPPTPQIEQFTSNLDALSDQISESELARQSASVSDRSRDPRRSRSTRDLKIEMRSLIKEASQGQPTMPEFMDRLYQKGVYAQVKYHHTKDGASTVNGITYRYQGKEFAGTEVHKLYTFNRLQSSPLNITYVPARDDEAIQQINNRLPVAAPPISVAEVGDRQPVMPTSDVRPTRTPQVSPIADQLRRVIDETVQHINTLPSIPAQPSPLKTMPAFLNRLQSLGIDVQVQYQSTGRVNGIRYTVSGVSFSGTDLGAPYTFPALQKRGVAYDPKEHLQEVQQISAQSPDREFLRKESQTAQVAAIVEDRGKRLYQYAWQVFQESKQQYDQIVQQGIKPRRSSVAEIAPGVWEVGGQHFVLQYQESSKILKIVHRKRGELLRAKTDTHALKYGNPVIEKDVRAFADLLKKLEQRQVEQQRLEQQRRLQPQKRSGDLER